MIYMFTPVEPGFFVSIRMTVGGGMNGEVRNDWGGIKT